MKLTSLVLLTLGAYVAAAPQRDDDDNDLDTCDGPGDDDCTTTATTPVATLTSGTAGTPATITAAPTGGPVLICVDDDGEIDDDNDGEIDSDDRCYYVTTSNGVVATISVRPTGRDDNDDCDDPFDDDCIRRTTTLGQPTATGTGVGAGETGTGSGSGGGSGSGNNNQGSGAAGVVPVKAAGVAVVMAGVLAAALMV